jgi:hypothetical protein
MAEDGRGKAAEAPKRGRARTWDGPRDGPKKALGWPRGSSGRRAAGDPQGAAKARPESRARDKLKERAGSGAEEKLLERPGARAGKKIKKRAKREPKSRRPFGREPPNIVE